MSWLPWGDGNPTRGWRKGVDAWEREVAWLEGYVTGTGPDGTVYRHFIPLSLTCRINISNVKASGALEAGGERDLEAFNRTLEAVRARLGLDADQMALLLGRRDRRVIGRAGDLAARVLAQDTDTPAVTAHG